MMMMMRISVAAMEDGGMALWRVNDGELLLRLLLLLRWWL